MRRSSPYRHVHCPLQHLLTTRAPWLLQGFVVGEQLESFPAFLNVDGHVTGELHPCAVVSLKCSAQDMCIAFSRAEL